MVATRSYFAVMRAIGIKALKNKLSEYVRIAAAGERVLVMDRDRVVAELVPPQPSIRGGDEAVLAEAIRTGYARPPIRPLNGVPARVGGFSFDDVMSGLDADRADRGTS